MTRVKLRVRGAGADAPPPRISFASEVQTVNGHRPGRETRKPKNWMTPGRRREEARRLAAEKSLQATGNIPIAQEKPMMCDRCRGTDFVLHDENFKRCANCGKKKYSPHSTTETKES